MIGKLTFKWSLLQEGDGQGIDRVDVVISICWCSMYVDKKKLIEGWFILRLQETKVILIDVGN